MVGEEDSVKQALDENLAIDVFGCSGQHLEFDFAVVEDYFSEGMGFEFCKSNLDCFDNPRCMVVGKGCSKG